MLGLVNNVSDTGQIHIKICKTFILWSPFRAFKLHTKFMNFFLFLWVIFCLPESGSGSRLIADAIRIRTETMVCETGSRTYLADHNLSNSSLNFDKKLRSMVPVVRQQEIIL